MTTQTVTVDLEQLEQWLEALENSIDLVSREAREAESLYGKYPSRLAKVQGLVALEVAHEKAITDIKEALAKPEQSALDAIFQDTKETVYMQAKRIAELEAQLAQPEQEPVAFLTNRRQRLNVEFNATGLTLMPKSVDWKIPLYTTPPTQQSCSQRQCNAVSMKHIKPLTDEQIDEVYYKSDLEIERQYNQLYAFARAIEAAHGITGETK